MPDSKRRRAPGVHRSYTKRVALNKRIIALQTEINRLKKDRDVVNRSEFKEVLKSLADIHRNTASIATLTKDVATQFTRIAQMQAEFDSLKRALAKAGFVA